MKVVYLDWHNDWAASACLLQRVYELMEEQGVRDRTLNDGTITNVTEFVGSLLSDRCMTFAIYHEGKNLVALCWFNLFEGRTCRGHFWCDRESWGKHTLSAICTMLSYILTVRNGDGFLFDTVIGLTPVSNSLAWRLITRCGGKVVGTIPHACKHNDGSVEDGILTVTTRESLEAV